jgi:hypothetical protein
VEFAYNASRALGIEHTPFEANFGFPLEEPLICYSECDLLFRFRKTRHSDYMNALVRSVLQLHKDEMQARTEPLTAPHFVRGDKVSVVTTNLFLRGQTNKN